MGLYDAVLIKDNHLAGIPVAQLAARLTELLERKPPAATFVEVEVDRFEQLVEVCKVAGVDIVLLDNFSLSELRRAVEYRDGQDLRGQLALEASGRVSLENVAAIAAAGVDRISVGALTHSATTLDIGLDI
jgi:nicotinate-nucleotide pyrophosphorylase (carboxylating)